MLPTTPEDKRLRLLEPLAALSLVTDLAHGRPAEQALEAALLAANVATELGESPAAVSEALYVTLLRSLGCTATSHEYATNLGGDDIAVRREGDVIDPTNPREGIAFVRRVARQQPRGRRVGVLATGVVHGRRIAAQAAQADCEVAHHGHAPGTWTASG